MQHAKMEGTGIILTTRGSLTCANFSTHWCFRFSPPSNKPPLRPGSNPRPLAQQHKGLIVPDADETISHSPHTHTCMHICMHSHTGVCCSHAHLEHVWLVAVHAAQSQPCSGAGVLLGVVAALDAVQGSLQGAAVVVRGKERQRVGFLGQLLGATLEM